VSHVEQRVDADSRAARFEAARVDALRRFGVLDTPPEAAFDDLTTLAARRCDMPMAVISLTDSDRLWFKSRVGVDLAGTPRELAMCEHPPGSSEVIVIADTHTDPRFADHPLVTGEPGIRFCASAPLVTTGVYVLGTLCVMDVVPRELDDTQLEDLAALARQVVSQLELRRQAEDLAAEVAATVVTQAALREHQRVMDTIVAETDLNIYAKDLQGRYILASDPLVRKLGLQQEMLGRTDHEMFPADLADAYRGNDLRIESTGATDVFDEQFVHPNGSVRSYHSTKFPLHDDHGKVYGVAGLSIDVTELASARRGKLESDQRWRALVEHSLVAVTVISQDGVVCYANPRAVTLLEAESLEWLAGRKAVSFVPPGAEAAATALLASVLQDGPPILARRVPLLTRAASTLTVECSAAKITYEGRPALQVELRDVTERAQAELALRVSERRFHAVFEDSPVAMGLSDEQGRWVVANAAFGHLLGVQPAQLIGKTAHEFADPADHPLIDASEQGQRDSPDGVLRTEMRFIRPDGDLRVAWMSITPTPGPAGEPWTLAIAQDITARKAAETALRESESDLTAIAAVARCVQSGDDPRPIVVSALQELAMASSVSIIEELDEANLIITANVGTPAAVIGMPVPLDENSMTAHVWRTGQQVFVPDLRRRRIVSPVLRALDATISALWQPVIIHGRVEAVLVVTWRDRVENLDTRSARVVRVIADEAGASLQATRLLRELERSATTDPLTGLLNRRAWDAHLRALMVDAAATGAPLTIALVDLDYFKSFNDRFGHAAGDVLLSDFAASARDCLRKKDVFARWGGEEFIIALDDCEPAEAEQILERVRASVPGNLTCSIGHASWDGDEPMSACVGRADAALYEAKRGGRDRIMAS
jgi:diguanylate cyclase (GGDEF)-like protein/PAS domain S-box-containing protein